jgi:hypothetical protein
MFGLGGVSSHSKLLVFCQHFQNFGDDVTAIYPATHAGIPVMLGVACP